MLTRSTLTFLIAVSLLGCSGSADSFEYMEDDLPAGNCRGTTTSPGNCDTDTAASRETDAAPTSDGDADTGSGGSSTGDVSSSGGPVDACSQSDECTGGICAAQFDPDTSGRSGFECVFACIDNFDDVGWCADDSGCCDAEATCSPRGYCLPPEG